MKEEEDSLLQTTLLKKMMVPPISAPATFNSLNIGSLFTGAEMGGSNICSSGVAFDRGCFHSLSGRSMDEMGRSLSSAPVVPVRTQMVWA